MLWVGRRRGAARLGGRSRALHAECTHRVDSEHSTRRRAAPSGRKCSRYPSRCLTPVHSSPERLDPTESDGMGIGKRRRTRAECPLWPPPLPIISEPPPEDCSRVALSRPRSSLAEATTWVFFERRSAYSHISKALVNSAKWPSLRIGRRPPAL